jgi:hypothetical protein
MSGFGGGGQGITTKLPSRFCSIHDGGGFGGSKPARNSTGFVNRRRGGSSSTIFAFNLLAGAGDLQGHCKFAKPVGVGLGAFGLHSDER